MGIDEDGYRQILGFHVGGHESAHVWEAFLQDLYRRGAHEILIGVFDGLVGLEEAFHSVYPKADVQRCVVHKMRSTFPKIRVKDKVEFLGDLKSVYTAPCYEEAIRQFHIVEQKWYKPYPRELESWKWDLPVLLTFYKYPRDIWPAIYTTNAIERTVKEMRKRLYPMNSVPNIDAAEKIVYWWSRTTTNNGAGALFADSAWKRRSERLRKCSGNDTATKTRSSLFRCTTRINSECPILPIHKLIDTTVMCPAIVTL